VDPGDVVCSRCLKVGDAAGPFSFHFCVFRVWKVSESNSERGWRNMEGIAGSGGWVYRNSGERRHE